MNKEYTYIDGKVIIKDENGEQKPGEYYDNLDKVLVQENVIETMEDRIKVLETESEKYKKENKKRFIPIIFPLFAIAPALMPVLLFLFGDFGIFVTTVETVFGVMNKALFYTILFSFLYLPLSVVALIQEYSEHKVSRKKAKGVTSELEFLRKQLVDEKQILDELKNDKTKNNENEEFRVVEVNDIDKLRMLKQFLELSYNLGYNEDKYFRYYQNGELENKLKKFCNEEEIQLANDYFQEKGPILTRRKDIKKR